MTNPEYWSSTPKPCRKPLRAKEYWENGKHWKTIPLLQLGNRFEVTDDGLVRHARTKRLRGQSKSPRGYMMVKLERKFYRVHRLVAFAFLGWPRPDQTHVNHIDNNPANNNLENLEWATPLENARHAKGIGALVPLKGSRNGASKLDEKQVLEIRQKYISGAVRQVDLAAVYGVSQRAISLIVRGEKWKHV